MRGKVIEEPPDLDDIVEIKGKRYYYMGQRFNDHLGVYYDTQMAYAHLLKKEDKKYSHICSTPLADREKDFARNLIFGHYEQREEEL